MFVCFVSCKKRESSAVPHQRHHQSNIEFCPLMLINSAAIHHSPTMAIPSLPPHLNNFAHADTGLGPTHTNWGEGLQISADGVRHSSTTGISHFCLLTRCWSADHCFVARYLSRRAPPSSSSLSLVDLAGSKQQQQQQQQQQEQEQPTTQ